MEGYHKSVLVAQVVTALQANRALLICDGTAGDGGHIEALFQAMPADGRIIGVDMDPEALRRASARLSAYANRCQLLQGNFRDLAGLIPPQYAGCIDGIVVDLGVSTLQISDPAKGFMFSADGPLAMQMDPQRGLSAETVVNDYEERDLAEIIQKFGEERAFRRIARAIVRARGRGRISTTGQLAEIVRRAVPGPHVVKSCARVFQSLRIHVNDELTSLERFLPCALEILRPGGRLAVISYHSLEDRRVKEFIRSQAFPCQCPYELPICVCGAKPNLKMVGKLVVPSAEEVASNPHARSARMRIAEKL